MTDEKPIKYIWSCSQNPMFYTDEKMERLNLYYENKFTLIQKHVVCYQPKSLCPCERGPELSDAGVFFCE